MMTALWWVWIAAGLALAILEVMLPGFLFAGFAVGAVITGGWIGLELPGTVSVIAWLGLRQVLGVRKGQMKRIDHDINEN